MKQGYLELAMTMNSLSVRKLVFLSPLNTYNSIIYLDWCLRGHIKYESDAILVTLEMIGDNETLSVQIDIVVEGKIPKCDVLDSTDSTEIEHFASSQLLRVLQTSIDGLFSLTKLECLKGVNVGSFECSFVYV